MIQMVDFLNQSEIVGYTENFEKISYNLSKFPHYKDYVEQQRELCKESLSTWVAGKWIVLYLDSPANKEGIMYFFDHQKVNFKKQTFFTEEVNQMLLSLQTKYKPNYLPTMDTVQLRVEFLN